jgi:hypothetical protein
MYKNSTTGAMGQTIEVQEVCRILDPNGCDHWWSVVHFRDLHRGITGEVMIFGSNPERDIQADLMRSYDAVGGSYDITEMQFGMGVCNPLNVSSLLHLIKQ